MLRIVALLSITVTSGEAWATPRLSSSRHSGSSPLNMLPAAAASVVAGSVAGAVGVGVAFPLDTVKTKQQVAQEDRSIIEYAFSPSGEIWTVKVGESSFFTTVGEIWEAQGVGGFYGGVSTSMFGQALIKATAFSVNTAVLQANYNLVIAAATAGLITAFLAVPVDRIKIMMQTESFENEFACVKSIIDREGLKGLLSTGLVPTICREVPAYTLYFYLYGSLMCMASETLGAAAPAISGALAGAICVVPVHPIDVVKTNVQHSAADWQDVVADIYEGRGLEGFWEGLTPRMCRAAVNHAITFTVFDVLVNNLASQ